VLETEVGPGSEVVGATIQALHHRCDLRVLALDGRWRPREDIVIEAGAAISVVGTREACEDVRSQSRRAGRRREPVAPAPVAPARVARRYRGAALGDD
jgi:Trk K+ transport system NAD-binding subunit